MPLTVHDHPRTIPLPPSLPSAGLPSLALLLALLVGWVAPAALTGRGPEAGERSLAEEPTMSHDPRDAEAATAEHGGRKNRLAGESSPYLLLHQHNPVDWYPWGEEALKKAKEEDRPIFLSVGYSTCYWCHVMERESFSDPEIAALMNRAFINIKVDREERPDLDEIYMAATQILTGQGGWPNSVFLTPDLKPFYAGTYFPPRDRHGRPGFGSLVVALSEAWKNRRGEIASQAEEMAAAMGRYLEERGQPGSAPPSAVTARRSAEALARRFDREWGGFSQAPKFPTPSNLFLLHELAGRGPGGAPTADEPSAGELPPGEMLRTTLDRMAQGGLYDQLGGGFHRYSTDRQWLVPHFEKMLYDNGFLLELYALEYARTGEPEWARIVRETAAFLAREMTSPEGAFYSAIDAETGGHEGAFYVWTGEELRGILGEEDSTFLAPVYGFDRPPFFEEGHYVLHLSRPIADLAAARRMSPGQLWEEIRPLRERLLAARGERPRPLTDTKILTDWNGIAIAGLAEAGLALDEGKLTERAARAARFLLNHLRSGSGAGKGTLLHAWRNVDGDGGTAKIPAYLGDYVFLVRGLLALDRAEPGKGWLATAVELTDEQIRRLADPEGGFFVAAAAPDLLFRSKEIFDGATPSANAVAALNLLELARLTGEERFRRQADATLRAFAPLAERHPDAVRMLTLAAWRRGGGEISAPPPPGSPGARLEAEARKVVTARAEIGEELAETGAWYPFTLRLVVAPGWHVNANPASDPFLIPTEVSGNETELRHLTYPEATILKPAFADEAIAVYSGEVEIHGEVRARVGQEAVRLTYQACDDARCLPPVTLRLNLGDKED